MDSYGRRIREGGAQVQVYVEPAFSSQQQERIDATVLDHNDGTYTASYTVPSKGNYKVRTARPALAGQLGRAGPAVSTLCSAFKQWMCFHAALLKQFQAVHS